MVSKAQVLLDCLESSRVCDSVTGELPEPLVANMRELSKALLASAHEPAPLHMELEAADCPSDISMGKGKGKGAPVAGDGYSPY